MKKYKLAKDFNYFGTAIPRGTIYTQAEKNLDRYIPHFHGSTHPNLAVSFMIVQENPDYFESLNTKYAVDIITGSLISARKSRGMNFLDNTATFNMSIQPVHTTKYPAHIIDRPTDLCTELVEDMKAGKKCLTYYVSNETYNVLSKGRSDNSGVSLDSPSFRTAHNDYTSHKIKIMFDE